MSKIIILIAPSMLPLPENISAIKYGNVEFVNSTHGTPYEIDTDGHTLKKWLSKFDFIYTKNSMYKNWKRVNTSVFQKTRSIEILETSILHESCDYNTMLNVLNRSEDWENFIASHVDLNTKTLIEVQSMSLALNLGDKLGIPAYTSQLTNRQRRTIINSLNSVVITDSSLRDFAHQKSTQKFFDVFVYTLPQKQVSSMLSKFRVLKPDGTVRILMDSSVRHFYQPVMNLLC